MNLTLKSVEVAVICLVLTALLGLKIRTIGSRDKELPPGPKTSSFLGNALDFPTSFPYLKFFEWTRRYGGVFSLKVFNQTVIVVTTVKAVKHILDNQGLHTGNRSRSVLVQRVTNGFFMVHENMENPVWKNSRKAMHIFFTEGSLERHLQTQQVEYSHLMLDILEDPKNLFKHICRTTASIMNSLLYGTRITKYKGSQAQAFFRGVKLYNELTDSAAHPPVNFCWPLQYVPKRWAYWKRLADTTRGIRDELYGSQYELCKRAIEKNKQTGCYVEELILNREKLGMTREEIIGMGGVMMDGGAETTASFLLSFVLALINNPHVQERGQKEIDSVVHPNRWPTLDDYERVPYIRAITDEVHRFRTILPIAIPHVSTKEIQYSHYRIPKDSIIIMNTYGIFHDPEMYDDPEIFEPERYVRMPFGTKEGVDTRGYRNNLAFGSERRACPGENMARRTIALITMNLLWTFNFKKDGSGTGGHDLDSYAKPGLELAPNPFTCDITPRSAVKAQMIRDRYAKAFPAGLDGAIIN